MQYYALILLALPASAQTTVYSYDTEGRRMELPAPSQKVEERVVSEGPDGKTVERLLRKFDESGRPTGVEKQLVEERNAGGAKSVRVTTWEKDVNGSFALRERATTATTQSGSAQNTQTVVERPSINGSMEMAERRLAVKTGDEKANHTDVTVYRPGVSGGLAETERQVIEVRAEGSSLNTTTAQYNSAATGRMELAGQRVSRLTKNADGSEVEVVDVYGVATPGRAVTDTTPKLREEQIIERKPGQDKSLTQTLSVRRPSLDSGQLGPATKISETVCKGDCKK